MPFGLTINTERATAFQQAVQDELMNRGYSQDADPVMAEYITIMVINNKSAAQITSELEDLISTDIDPSFTSWLFDEAAKGAAGSEIAPVPSSPAPAEASAEPGPSKEIPTYTGNDSSTRRPTGAPRNGVYQQALSQALPSSSAQKRSASARSPSPTHPNKSRRTDLPTGPRAMQKEGPGPRSLLDRVGGPANNRPNGHGRDEIQRRIESVTGAAQEPNMMMPQGFVGMPPGMDVNAMANANMMNPMMLQEMMMSQMAMMAQMASSMGMLNPATGQFSGGGMPMHNGMPGDMSMVQNGMNNFQGQAGGHGHPGRGRGVGRGGRGAGRGGRGNVPLGGHGGPQPPQQAQAGETPAIVSPTPVIAAPLAHTPSSSSVATDASSKPAYAIPERPQSPTLCKFGTKCSNAHCRYSHPSPVATAESGVVLSNDPCENGKNCVDKDCTKAHVSPAVLNPNAEFSAPPVAAPPPRATHTANAVPCRFGLACTRPGCTFSHPPRPSHGSQPCRFGTACTKASCTFQHPPGRVLPSTFHRGLSTSGGMSSVAAPETGTMSGTSHNKSMTFNTSSSATVKEKLEKQMKELEEKKQEMEKAMKDAASKKDDNKSVPISA
ncbi:hypothetical protein D9611_004006 [Ephemerocybe angulata]|uniref:Nab2 type CCCH zinc finger 4 domain-containing protein n=1 Tax=Ephemerocybe angulata TaxID=980116 RepID=A0A8H5B5I4_9AGAR|nr:hypothetical protein D9611_004006 [Tulosesus angulatus]